MAKGKDVTPSFAAVSARLEKDLPGALRAATGITNVRRVPLGIFEIDRVLEGGLPSNRLNTIYGPKGVFKTTLALKAVKSFMARCECCFVYRDQCQTPKAERPEQSFTIIIDTERTLDETYLSLLRMDIEHIKIFRPPYGEAACEYAEEFSRLKEVGAILIDSLANVQPKAEVEAGYLDSLQMGSRAKLINRLCTSMINHIDKPEPKFVVMINHMQTNMQGHTYIPGGVKNLYNSSTVLKLWQRAKGEYAMTTEEMDKILKKQIEDGDEGILRLKEMGFLVEHSKTSQAGISGEFGLYTDNRTDEAIFYGDSNDWKAVFTWASALGLVEVNGAVIIGEKKFQSQKALFKYWREHPTTYDQIKKDIVDAFKQKTGR
jgi:RecA/RadA recombinase